LRGPRGAYADKQTAQEGSGGERNGQADSEANGGQSEAIGEHHAQDDAPLRTQRHADSDFLGSPAYHEGNHTVQSDDRQRQSHDAENAAQYGDDPGQEKSTLRNDAGHGKNGNGSNFGVEGCDLRADWRKQGGRIAVGAHVASGFGVALFKIWQIENRRRRCAHGTAATRIFHYTDNLKGCIVAETNDVSEGLADVTVRRDVAFSEGLVDDSDAGRLPGFALADSRPYSKGICMVAKYCGPT
jgi:hypothetical protein